MFKRKKQPSASKDPGPVDNGPGVGSREATTGTGQVYQHRYKDSLLFCVVGAYAFASVLVPLYQ